MLHGITKLACIVRRHSYVVFACRYLSKLLLTYLEESRRLLELQIIETKQHYITLTFPFLFENREPPPFCKDDILNGLEFGKPNFVLLPPPFLLPSFCNL